jgi:hypothetical protein
VFVKNWRQRLYRVTEVVYSMVTGELLIGAVLSLIEEEKQATMLSTRVGEYVVFNCPLDFPHDYVIPYILRWNKEVSPYRYVHCLASIPLQSNAGMGPVF